MKRYGKCFNLTQNVLDVLATYMFGDIREKVHNELTPCKPEDFLNRYIQLDPDFSDLLKNEFGIEL